MYDISYFKEEDPQQVLDFIRSHPFGMLIGASGNTPVATQVPFLIEEKEGRLILTGHIMRKTDHHLAFEENRNVLCVFTGAHSYVSARWYANQQTASTWNYISVHARGSISFVEGEGLREILQRTTDHFESDQDSPANYRHLPNDYVERLEKAIVGIKIEVTGIENVFKLSQNKTEKEKDRIINELQNGDEQSREIAREMKLRP